MTDEHGTGSADIYIGILRGGRWESMTGITAPGMGYLEDSQIRYAGDSVYVALSIHRHINYTVNFQTRFPERFIFNRSRPRIITMLGTASAPH